MKILKIVLVILALSLVGATSLSCRAEAGSSENQTATVQRGDLTTDITGAGNLALSDKVDLAFETDGTVEEVLVKEGDSVEKGQVLANLDTSAWDDYVAELKDKVTAAERNVTVRERAVTAAERQVLTRQVDLLQAQINLQTAQDNLNKVEVVAEAKKAVDDAEYDLRIARAMLQQAGLSQMSQAESSFWLLQVKDAQTRLTDAQKELKEVSTGNSVKVTDDMAKAVALNKLQVEVAQGRLEDAPTAVADAKAAVGEAKIAVEDARTAVKKAKEALDEALNIGPAVTAPFAGFITKVNVKGGDEVKRGTVAVTIADPAKFEADILVNEMDLPQVKLGGEASVRVDALRGLSLSANVTYIAPTATIQSGVVNYKVKVEIPPLQSVTSEQPLAAGSITSGNISSGRQQQPRQRMPTGNATSGNTSSAPSGRSGQASGSGQPTQEQISQMMQQRQQAQAGQTGGQQPQMPTKVSPNLQLREGMTVTVTIIVQQKSSVLLVPNTAITTRRGQAYVQVLTSSGTTEQRTIQAGISNWQYTEITSGLSEGEKVIIPKVTTTTPTTPQPGGSPMRIPGMGGFGR